MGHLKLVGTGRNGNPKNVQRLAITRGVTATFKRFGFKPLTDRVTPGILTFTNGKSTREFELTDAFAALDKGEAVEGILAVVLSQISFNESRQQIVGNLSANLELLKLVPISFAHSSYLFEENHGRVNNISPVVISFGEKLHFILVADINGEPEPVTVAMIKEAGLTYSTIARAVEKNAASRITESIEKQKFRLIRLKDHPGIFEIRPDDLFSFFHSLNAIFLLMDQMFGRLEPRFLFSIPTTGTILVTTEDRFEELQGLTQSFFTRGGDFLSHRSLSELAQRSSFSTEIFAFSKELEQTERYYESGVHQNSFDSLFVWFEMYTTGHLTLDRYIGNLTELITQDVEQYGAVPSMAYLHRAKALIAKKKYNEAISDLCRAKSRMPTEDVFLTMAQAHLLANRPRMARDSFERATLYNPNSVKAYVHLATLWAKLDDAEYISHAMKYARMAHFLKPEEPQVKELMQSLRSTLEKRENL